MASTTLTTLPSEILRHIDSFLPPMYSIELRYSAPSLYADLKHRKQVDETRNEYYYKKNGKYYMKLENRLDRELSTGKLAFEKAIVTQEYIRKKGVFGREKYSNLIGKIVYTIFDMDNYVGYYQFVVSKEYYTLVKHSYDVNFIRKYHKHVLRELREKVEEAAREEKRKHPVFVIKGNSKPTNPWKKI
jgi:hypothetical protein